MAVKSFAVLNRAERDDVIERHPALGRIAYIDKLLQPYKYNEMNFNDVIGVNIKIPGGFERGKIGRAYKRGVRNYGYVLSRDYNINYNPFFHHSCLIRALDFYTIKLGCDLRLSEVVIADAATVEGKNAFRLLLPIARRIVLVTEQKSKLLEEVEYAIFRYGSSVAVIEDPVKAAERADIIVIASDNINHRYIADLDRPMLYFRYITPPKSSYWFDGVDISYGENEFDIIYAQGYTDVNEKKPLWYNAEIEGFRIKNIKRGKDCIEER